MGVSINALTDLARMRLASVNSELGGSSIGLPLFATGAFRAKITRIHSTVYDALAADVDFTIGHILEGTFDPDSVMLEKTIAAPKVAGNQAEHVLDGTLAANGVAIIPENSVVFVTFTSGGGAAEAVFVNAEYQLLDDDNLATTSQEI